MGSARAMRRSLVRELTVFWATDFMLVTMRGHRQLCAGERCDLVCTVGRSLATARSVQGGFKEMGLETGKSVRRLLQ